MSFELKQIVTQIVAFLIMLWILKRYLWRPLMILLDKRTQTIQNMFKEAEEKNKQSDELKAEYEDKIRGIEDEGQVIIQNAVKDSQKIARDIQLDAQKKAHELIHKAQEQAEMDLVKARVALKKDIVDLSFDALEKLVKVKLTPEDRERFGLELIDEV